MTFFFKCCDFFQNVVGHSILSLCCGTYKPQFKYYLMIYVFDLSWSYFSSVEHKYCMSYQLAWCLSFKFWFFFSIHFLMLGLQPKVVVLLVCSLFSFNNYKLAHIQVITLSQYYYSHCLPFLINACGFLIQSNPLNKCSCMQEVYIMLLYVGDFL